MTFGRSRPPKYFHTKGDLISWYKTHSIFISKHHLCRLKLYRYRIINGKPKLFFISSMYKYVRSHSRDFV